MNNLHYISTIQSYPECNTRQLLLSSAKNAIGTAIHRSNYTATDGQLLTSMQLNTALIP